MPDYGTSKRDGNRAGSRLDFKLTRYADNQGVGMVVRPPGDGNTVNFGSGAEEKSQFTGIAPRQSTPGHVGGPSGRTTWATAQIERVTIVRYRYFLRIMFCTSHCI
jgi:hypothetical protein